MMRRAALVVLLSALPVQAASYYISTTGNDTNGCTNETTDACASFNKCAQVMDPGDTCYARGGTYTVPPNYAGSGKRGWPIYHATGGSASARYTFTSYPGELAIIVPESYHNSTQESTFAINNSACDYLTFTGLQIQGRLYIQGNTEDGVDNLIIEKNIFKCPGACGTGNTNNIMSADIASSTGMKVQHDNLIVRNNYFTIDSSCPDYDVFCNNQEVDFVHTYSMNAPVFENNDFILADPSKVENTPQGGGLRYALWTKGRAQYAQLRYNYCEGVYGSCVAINTGDCPNRPEYAGPPECGDSTAKPSEGYNEIHHNVSYRSGGFGWIGCNYAVNDKVYNNTAVDLITSSGTGKNSGESGRGQDDLSIFNNIYTVDTALYPNFGGYDGYIFWRSYYSHAYDGFCSNTYVGNNLYYGHSPAKASNWHLMSPASTPGQEISASTLSEWKSDLATVCSSNPDVRETGSIDSAPLFVDEDGKDFRLQAGSPALGAGRGGSYSSNMGAYDTGTEVIGCSFYAGCFSYDIDEAPISAGNPRRVDFKGVSFK